MPRFLNANFLDLVWIAQELALHFPHDFLCHLVVDKMLYLLE